MTAAAAAVTLLGLAVGAGVLTWGVGFLASAVSDAITQAVRRARIRRRQPPLGQLVRHPALDEYVAWRDGAPVTEAIVAQPPTLVLPADPDPALGCRWCRDASDPAAQPGWWDQPCTCGHQCTHPYCLQGDEAHPW